MKKKSFRKLKQNSGKTSKILIFDKLWKLLHNFGNDGSNVGSQMPYSSLGLLLFSFLWLQPILKRQYCNTALSTVAIAKL